MRNFLQYHQWLLTEHNRTSGYREAINRIVRKGDVVLDIGTGSGILSFFACLAGARKVYAVEQSDAIELAREICAVNGFGERITLLKDRSQNIKLPESVDVIVTDTGASFGLQDGTLGSLMDARRRFLKPHGQILPQSLDLFVAPVELKTTQNLDAWNKDRYGLDLSPIRQFAACTNYQMTLEPDNLLALPQLIVNVNLQEADTVYVSGEAMSIAQRNGVMDGIGAWNSVNLVPGISFNNSPINPTVDWARSFFPIETPVSLRTGDAVKTRVSTYNGKEWRWQVEIAEGPMPHAPIKAKFDHSTLRSFPIRSERLKKRLPLYAPKLSRKGEAEAYVLSAFDGKRTAKELAEDVCARFADCFPTKTAATEFVNKAIERCS